MPVFLLIVAIAIGLWLGSNAWSLARNYRLAKKTGLPVFISIANPDFIPWMITAPSFMLALHKILPASLLNRLKCTTYGWEFLDKDGVLKNVGPVFILVNPGTNELQIADPEWAQMVLARRKDFVQSPTASMIISFLGNNMLTVDGEDWARQRRLIAPSLNERISDIVWQESSEQAERMVEYLLAQPDGVSNEAVDCLRSIALNVLGKAAYGQQQAWKPNPPTGLTKDGKISYFDAIAAIINCLVPAAVLPTRLLQLSFMPSSFQAAGLAKQQYSHLTKELLNRERSYAASGGEEHTNIMATLAKLSDAASNNEKGDTAPAAKGALTLTQPEIEGNLFLLTAAGYDTTANAMGYAITLLAAHPQWQSWLLEEIDAVFPLASATTTSPSNQKSPPRPYAETFPLLPRCLALMYETLRLYPPLVHATKAILSPQVVSMNGKTYHIPAETKCYINFPALHLRPDIWGPDSRSFRPARWIDPATGTLQGPPARGTFLPWSLGPRSCPGMKMSQVEFVAVVSTLLSRARVEVVPLPGEKVERARQKLMECLEDSQPRLTLQMNRPGDVVLRWVGRG